MCITGTARHALAILLTSNNFSLPPQNKAPFIQQKTQRVATSQCHLPFPSPPHTPPQVAGGKVKIGTLISYYPDQDLFQKKQAACIKSFKNKNNFPNSWQEAAVGSGEEDVTPHRVAIVRRHKEEGWAGKRLGTPSSQFPLFLQASRISGLLGVCVDALSTPELLCYIALLSYTFFPSPFVATPRLPFSNLAWNVPSLQAGAAGVRITPHPPA